MSARDKSFISASSLKSERNWKVEKKKKKGSQLVKLPIVCATEGGRDWQTNLVNVEK